MSSITFAHRQFMTRRPRKTTVSAGRFPFFVGMDLETIYKCGNPSRISQALSLSSFDYLQYTHMYTHTKRKKKALELELLYECHQSLLMGIYAEELGLFPKL